MDAGAFQDHRARVHPPRRPILTQITPPDLGQIMAAMRHRRDHIQSESGWRPTRACANRRGDDAR
jgi:hypothetical protein